MKYFTGILFSLFLLASCTDDCCEPGETIVAAFSGTLKCVNDNAIANVIITLTDDTGATHTSTTNTDGEYSFATLPGGSYTMSFDNPQAYSYTTAEYDTFIADLYDVILAVRPTTTSDEIAYHVTAADNGLTTLDRVYWQKIRDGERQLSEFSFPWRYITSTDLAADLVSINETLEFNISQGATFVSDIVGIYYGDPTGATCN